jgi:hypothetical protein
MQFRRYHGEYQLPAHLPRVPAAEPGIPASSEIGGLNRQAGKSSQKRYVKDGRDQVIPVGSSTMKKMIVAALAALFLASCVETQSYGGSYRGPEPIPGSITYGGQPRTKLRKAPIGSTLHNNFYGPYGERIEETYMVMPDRSLKLVARRRGFIGFPYD